MSYGSRMRWILALLLTAILAGGAWAAEVSPALDYELARAHDNDMVSAIVILESPIDIRALDMLLHDQRADLATRHKEVINALKHNAESTQPAMQAELDAAKDAGELVGYTAYWIENLFVIQARKSFIQSLRSRGDIRYLTENFQAELIEPIERTGKAAESLRGPRRTLDTRFVSEGVVAVGALRVNEELGITGNGVLVANCDTGVDGAHPALSARWRGTHAPWYHCWMDNLGTATTFPNDGYGHGTHVMGTECGRAVVGADTQWVGCAPAAEWIANNAINQGVSADFDNDIILTYQWFTDPDSNVLTLDDVPDVIQNSWGVFTGLGYAQCFDLWNTVVLNCEAAGPVVTWSAGNESTSGLRSPAIYSISAYDIFSVGAVDATNFGAPYPIASFSSQGPTPCTPAVPDNIKPEISAPGVDVYSSVPGGGYSGTYSGTSMAGPHVAGVVALMREACPNCDHITIKDAIMNTAIDYGTPGQDNVYGHGFIDGYAAVLQVSNLGRIGGIIRDANTLAPIVGATARNTASPYQTATTVAGGQYYLPLSAGTYNIEYSYFGYLSQTVNGLSVVTGDTTVQDVSLVPAPSGTVSGTVTNCFGNPANSATVEVLNTPVTPATTNGSGFYSITLPQGTYDLRASWPGCGPQTVTGVVIGASTTQNFTLPSDPIFSCSAPDAGNYVACEDGDLNGPTFSWLEVSPNAGGPGTNTGLTGDDQAVTVALPVGFTFRLYGVDYTTMHIGSNGYVTFNTQSTTYTNGPLEGLGQPVVALFWDDLYLPSGGDVSYYRANISGEDVMIVEWHVVPHINGSGAYTMQAWLYNYATSPTPWGDSKIRLQYLDLLGDINSMSIGTCNGTATYKNQYVYNATYDPNAQGMVNNRVVSYGESGVSQIGNLSGTITSCQGGPAVGATVSFPGSPYSPVTTNGAGFYSINVIAGTYTVAAANALCTAVQQAGNVVNAGQTTTVDLTLAAGGTLTGTVTSCTGGPAVGATVSISGGPYPVAPTTTNGAGVYSFSPIPAGTYTVDVSFGMCTPGQAAGVAVTSGNTTTQNFTLTGGSLQGTVTSCLGGPAVGATVSVSGGPVAVPPTTTNGSGFYSFSPIPVGTYTVDVSFGGCAPGQATSVAVLNGQTTTQNFTLITDPMFACSPVDPYGYYACENNDPGGPTYAWMEIAPDAGGPGADAFVDCDDCFGGPFPLPFGVQFYGVMYTDYYIGSNGYITFGAGTSSLGGCFPSDFIPAGIFPFWTDLYTFCSTAQIATYYDVAGHRLIVEWYNTCHCCSEGNLENFQILIYDVAFVPTATGDNDIAMQYGSLSLPDFCTVGLKSASGPNYLQYSCQGTLDASSQGLVNGRVIYYTTGPGCSLGPSDIVVSPPSVTGAAPLGGTDTQTLQICNVGLCPLRWTIEFNQTTPAITDRPGTPGIMSMTKDQLELIAAINRGEKPIADQGSSHHGGEQLDAFGGPDAFGYRWKDSAEPDGPVFSWVDITTIGTNVGLTGDDQTVSRTLPFSFSFYGIAYSSVNVSSNGNLHFGAANAAYYNEYGPLPDPVYAPLAMIAPFWDDQYLPAGGTVYDYYDVVNNRYIVEWFDVDHYAGTGDSYTYQVILYPNGRILLQYLSLTTAPVGVTSCTVGIQNETATDGLTIVWDAPYLTDNLAIQIQASPVWLTVVPPLNGTIDPGNCVNVTLNFDAADLPTGTYTGNLLIDSNDPDELTTTVPVTFIVGFLDAPQQLTIDYELTGVHADQLRFEWLSTGAPSYTLLSSTSADGPFSTVAATTTSNVVWIPYNHVPVRTFYVVVATDGAGASSLPGVPTAVKSATTK